MPKILHCADLHLDSPFRSGNAEKAEVRRRELRGTFSSLLLYIKTEGVDLALMAGDIFDVRYVTRDTAAFFLKELAAASRCRFVIAPGNHDPYTEDGIYARSELPGNVFLFREPALRCFSFPDINTDVYGWAFTSATMETSPLTGRTPSDPSRINLVCAHADVGKPLSPYCPVSEHDLAESGFDYYAFGHVHTRSEIRKCGNSCYAYPGCLEGRDFGETGHKGAYLLTIEKDQGILSLKSFFRRFSTRRYETCDLDISGLSDGEAVRAAIRARLTEKGFGSDTLLRLTLRGSISPAFKPDLAALTAAFAPGLFWFELQDETLPLYDTALLEADPTIRGVFFARLRPMLENGTPEERLRAARALRIGLAALNGEDIAGVD